jgi:hypothetical protein
LVVTGRTNKGKVNTVTPQSSSTRIASLLEPEWKQQYYFNRDGQDIQDGTKYQRANGKGKIESGTGQAAEGSGKDVGTTDCADYTDSIIFRQD